MLRNQIDFFGHPETNDIIEVKWSPRAWKGLGLKHVGGYGSPDREEFEVNLRQLLEGEWVKLPGPPETSKEEIS